MVNIDEWIPNFQMFVLIILPALILMTFAVFVISWWINRPKKPEKTSMDWMEIMKLGTALYMIVPMYRIMQYVQGEIEFNVLIQGLFVEDFRNYMILALLTGIMGLVFILRKKQEQWKGVA
jgi:hypothetical protein